MLRKYLDIMLSDVYKASVSDIHVSGQDFSSQLCGWAVVCTIIIHV